MVVNTCTTLAYGSSISEYCSVVGGVMSAKRGSMERSFVAKILLAIVENPSTFPLLGGRNYGV